MKAENAKEGMFVRDRRVLCFGIIAKAEGRSVVYVVEGDGENGGDYFREVDATAIDPVATIAPILVQVECPVCRARSNRKPFAGWVVETCEECGEKYAAGPYQVGEPLDVGVE